jgi:hypothetical protein
LPFKCNLQCYNVVAVVEDAMGETESNLRLRMEALSTVGAAYNLNPVDP